MKNKEEKFKRKLIHKKLELKKKFIHFERQSCLMKKEMLTIFRLSNVCLFDFENENESMNGERERSLDIQKKIDFSFSRIFWVNITSVCLSFLFFVNVIFDMNFFFLFFVFDKKNKGC